MLMRFSMTLWRRLEVEERLHWLLLIGEELLRHWQLNALWVSQVRSTLMLLRLANHLIGSLILLLLDNVACMRRLLQELNSTAPLSYIQKALVKSGIYLSTCGCSATRPASSNDQLPQTAQPQENSAACVSAGPSWFAARRKPVSMC